MDKIHEDFWAVYYDKEVEEHRFRKTLEKLCEKDFVEKGRVEGINLGKSEQQRDMVISLNEQHVSLDIIAKAAKISLNKVKQIIGDYLENKKDEGVK